MAADPGSQNPEAGTDIGVGIYGEFVDANGNGVCDTYADHASTLDGTGSQWGAQNGGQSAQQINFVDKDGDGVCDNCLNGGVPAQDGIGSHFTSLQYTQRLMDADSRSAWMAKDAH